MLRFSPPTNGCAPHASGSPAHRRAKRLLAKVRQRQLILARAGRVIESSHAADRARRVVSWLQRHPIGSRRPGRSGP